MRTLNIEERLWPKIEKTSSCWIWKAARDRKGYGRFWFKGRNCHAHRVVYELVVGSVDPDLVLDHLCTTPLCVNPFHLEEVSRGENNKRALAANPTPFGKPRPVPRDVFEEAE